MAPDTKVRTTDTRTDIAAFSSTQKYVAECFGTATLVLVGCSAAVIGAAGGIGFIGIGFAFGLAVTAMAYTIGPISGCHINPAVTVAALASGRMERKEAAGYVVAQIVGAVIGAALLRLILSDKLGNVPAGLGQNGWGPGYLGEYEVMAAIVVEFIATFLFIAVILGSTDERRATPIAGLIIGLTLFALHLAFINVTGLSVNPARSLGPALFAGGQALAQLWLFLLVPTLAGLAAGLAARNRLILA